VIIYTISLVNLSWQFHCIWFCDYLNGPGLSVASVLASQRRYGCVEEGVGGREAGRGRLWTKSASSGLYNHACKCDGKANRTVIV